MFLHKVHNLKSRNITVTRCPKIKLYKSIMKLSNRFLLFSGLNL